MKKCRFIEINFQNYLISHGFDAINKEILEEIKLESPSKKLIAIDRIISVNEKHILTSYAGGRVIYWEYKETYEEIKDKLIR